MKAIVVREHGGVERLERCDLPDPIASEDLDTLSRLPDVLARATRNW